MRMNANSVRRQNSDRSVNSNLPPSLKTVAKESTVSHLKSSEDEHQVESAEELERRYVDSQRGTF